MDPVDVIEGINLQQPVSTKEISTHVTLILLWRTKVVYLITHLETYSILLNVHNYYFLVAYPSLLWSATFF